MIGIDFSMSSAGICIGDSDNPESLEMGCFRQRKSDEALRKNITIMELPEHWKTPEERYFKIATEIYNFIISKTDSKIVYLEGYSYGSSSGVVFNIAESTSVLKQMLYHGGFEINLVTPSELKKHATGKGNANKTKMLDAFIDVTGYDFNKTFHGPTKPVEKGMKRVPSPVNDIIDAYFLLQFGLNNQA